MKNINFVFLCLAILCFSCKGRKVTTSQAISYYDSINYQFNKTRPEQQAFIDKATESLFKIKYNDNVVIDTNDLHQYLMKAMLMNKQRLDSIILIKEVDEQIGYKGKVIKHAKLLSSLYSDEIRAYFKLLSQLKKGRFGMCSEILMPKLEEIKKAENQLKQAQTDFKSRYGFTTPNQ